MDVDEKLLAFANERQAEAINAYIEHGTYTKAASVLGINRASLQNLITRAKRKASYKGLVPELGIDKPFPDTDQVVSGYSRWFKTEDGGYWIKTNTDHQAYLAMISDVVDELKQGIPAVPPVTLDSRWNQPAELLNLYVLSDIHIGAMSWGEETGADWDLAIAEQTIMEAFTHLIESSSPAKYGFFCQLGDALHYDGWMPKTPASGHIVDTSCRFQEMVRMAIRCFHRAISMMLEKHEHVTVLHALGNHDPGSSAWLQECFAMYYGQNDRCNVIVNPSPYYAHMHGKTFLGMHHGHTADIKKLCEVFTGRRYWPALGDARQSYIHTGHKHHREVKEWNGGIIERHQTLAAPSSYESSGGWDADRSMTCITYHSAGQEHSRVFFYPRVLDAGLPKITKTAQTGVSAA